MPRPADPSPQRLSGEDAFLELLMDTLETVEQPARGQFLKRFFQSIAHVDLSETQSVDTWDQVLAHRRELSQGISKKIAFQTALVDVLASENLLRMPILMGYEELRNLKIDATSDPLTGLYNRRFFEEFFERELNRSDRYSHRLALVVFDLHHFKEVNDRYGHPQGDSLLQMVATTLKNSLRTSDYAFRIGGDEFALLLPQSDKEQAVALSRRLRLAYAAMIEPRHLSVPLALDYGLAVYPDDGKEREILIRVADERMYQLKGGTRSSGPAPADVAKTNPRNAERNDPVRSVTSPGPVTPPLEPAGQERRQWDRVSFASSKAYALIVDGVEFSANVIDLGYGGVALETTRAENVDETFHAVLHVPILPPVRVSLRRIYQTAQGTGTSRIGCSFAI